MRKKKGAWIYRSSLEKKVADLLPPSATFEPDKIEYIVPESKHKYTPDFKLRENTYIEVKGIFDATDRKKHLLIKEQHPEITIYFLFGKSHNKISRASKTTYADWADNHGFTWADFKDGIPKEWLEE